MTKNKIAFITPYTYKINKAFEKHIKEETEDMEKVLDPDTKEQTLVKTGTKTNVQELIDAERENVMELAESVEKYEDGLRPKGGYEAAKYGDFTKEPTTRAAAKDAMLASVKAKEKLHDLAEEEKQIIEREKQRQAKANLEKGAKNE